MANKPPEHIGPQPNKVNTLTQFSAPKGIGPKQQLLDLNIQRQAAVMDKPQADGNRYVTFQTPIPSHHLRQEERHDQVGTPESD
jgi:hypothetical protein